METTFIPELRAYCPDNEEMYYDDDVMYEFSLRDGVVSYYPRDCERNTMFSTQPDTHEKLIIVSLFSGLLGKKDYKIFEGEIMKCNKGFKYIVKFRSGEFRICRIDKSQEFRKGNSKQLAHIGNVWQFID